MKLVTWNTQWCCGLDGVVDPARIVDGAVDHLVPPSYHGNPMDPNGSLAFFDYGWELLDWVRDAGFRDVSRDRNSRLDSNGLRPPSATASGLWMK